MANLYLPSSTDQRIQSSWVVASVHAQVEVAAQAVVHAVRTVSTAHVILMKIIPHSIAIKTFYLMTILSTSRQ